MLEHKPLLLSLRPRHADAILDGRKTVEVRRRRVSAPAGTIVLIYASSPVKAVVATARLRGSLVCSRDWAWEEFSERLGLDRGEFDTYLKGVDPCLLLLENVRRLPSPLSLAALKEERPFRPPQSYRYVSVADPPLLRTLSSASAGGDDRSPIRAVPQRGGRARPPGVGVR